MLSYDREKHFCIYTFFAIKYFRFSLNLCKNYNLAENVHPSFTATPLLKVRSSHPPHFQNLVEAQNNPSLAGSWNLPRKVSTKIVWSNGWSLRQGLCSSALSCMGVILLFSQGSNKKTLRLWNLNNLPAHPPSPIYYIPLSTSTGE